MYIVLYETMYNDNIYLLLYNKKYISCIITTFVIQKCLLSLYIVSYNVIYIFMYKRNICCYYLSLYMKMYLYYASSRII